MMRAITFILFLTLLVCSCTQNKDVPTPLEAGDRWTAAEAWAWYDAQPYMIGTNFNPSTAINQLEFWQRETFDLETIDRELKWSADIGMNLHRVYLHNLLWDQDSIGFLNRIDQYLAKADNYNIKTMLVLLDDVWHPVPKLGKQPEPIPMVHNSGWVQAPGAAILGDSSRHDQLEGYIKGVMSRFKDDTRVVYWDIYNEPDNVTTQKDRAPYEVKDKHIYSLALLKKVFRWGREVNPSQPLTTGIWRGNIDHWGTPDSLPLLDRYMIEESDVISFHAYDGDTTNVIRKIEELKKYERPLLCTEYIARGTGNTFENVLPILRRYNIAAINWGLVAGKTNTIYPWSSWNTTFTEEPDTWHHDIFRSDGTPYNEAEIALIKGIR